MMKLRRNIPVSPKEHLRFKWPFAAMDINSVVDVKEQTEWRRAQRYAHQYAHKKKWKMHTQWMGNFGRIRRLS